MLLAVPRLGSLSLSPPAAAGQPSLQCSPFSNWKDSQQGAAGEILASAGERQPAPGKGGEESDAFPTLEHTILTSIPVIAATCCLSQPSPRSSPRSLLHSWGCCKIHIPPSPDIPLISFFRPRQSCTRSASRARKPSGAGREFPTHPETAEKNDGPWTILVPRPLSLFLSPLSPPA